MAQQVVELLDLPDELLLMILKNLHSIHVLYSLEGVNKRLDAMAVSVANSTVIHLDKNNFFKDGCSIYDTILDRFCSHILSRICHNIHVFGFEASIMERVLTTCKFPNLSTLLITEFCPETALHYLIDESPIANLFKEQITWLILFITSNTTTELLTKVYIRLLTLCKQLARLELPNLYNSTGTQLSLCTIPTNVCLSSTLCYLTVDLDTFNDCLYLLDGRLNQLSTFIVNITDIDTSSLDIDNTKSLPNLTIFSLTCISYTDVYDTQIVPLLRRMLNLNHLTLYIRTTRRSEFIDGTHLDNEICSHMLQLRKFNFHITTRTETSDPQHRQSLDDLQRTFDNWKFGQVKCCVDYFPRNNGKCDIYSIPYSFSYIYGVGNSFRGNLFKDIIRLTVSDQRPFEPDFFHWVANAFPNLRYFAVINEIPQARKRSDGETNDQHDFSILHYPNLVYLSLCHSHIDYINQFLRYDNTYITHPFSLNIDYERLVTVTDNFTNDATQTNCSKVKLLTINKSFVHPESFYLYFPLL